MVNSLAVKKYHKRKLLHGYKKHCFWLLESEYKNVLRLLEKERFDIAICKCGFEVKIKKGKISDICSCCHREVEVEDDKN